MYDLKCQALFLVLGGNKFSFYKKLKKSKDFA